MAVNFVVNNISKNPENSQWICTRGHRVKYSI